MKMHVLQNCSMIVLKPDSDRDMYLLGRIAAKLKLYVHNPDLATAELSIDFTKVLEELAK